jgi:hypothetical protein
MDALDISQIAANWSTALAPFLGAFGAAVFDLLKKKCLAPTYQQPL